MIKDNQSVLEVVWSIDDVLHLNPDYTQEECLKILDRLDNSKYIDVCHEIGWGFLNDAIEAFEIEGEK